MPSQELKRCVPVRAFTTLGRANQYSRELIATAKGIIDGFIAEKTINPEEVCFVVVGSVGRLEALEASDFDFIPVFKSEAALERYRPHDGDLRKALAAGLKTKVSKGEDLTKAIMIAELVEPDCIGGSKDSSGALTKRILILTESQEITGGYRLSAIRKKILEAYASENRTSGRHVLSLCNDIARYYKTLCIEYKAKIDEEDKDWCTRNMKLRHSRKLWYFANIVAIAKIAEDHPLGSDDYVNSLLDMLDCEPAERIVRSLCKLQPTETGRLLENYAMFLEFMSDQDNRSALAAVEHEHRYAMNLGNPFPAMKFNSDVMHGIMLSILNGLSSSMRDRVISWFML